MTDIAKYRNEDDPRFVIQNWMRNRNTIEFLGVWEELHNPDFNRVQFEVVKNEAGLNRFVMTPTKWITQMSAIGIVSKAGRYGGTYAHSDIAMSFATWISPEFQLYIMKDYRRLKTDENSRLSLNWNLNREISELNCRIHTDAIKENLIPPELTATQVAYTYANEADMLNVVLFGKTAKQWKDENPTVKGNLHQNVDLLPAIKVGATDEERERVKNFHSTVKAAGRLVDFYFNEEELKYKIAMAIPKIINDVPMPGWVRADQAEQAIATAKDFSGIQDLQNQLNEIENTILEKVEQTQMKWEPISKEEIDAMFNTEKEEVRIPILSEEAKHLLIEATKDVAGQILVIDSLEGTDIQTNNKIMNIDKIGKSVAIWRAAMEELRNNQLIMAVGNRNEIFQLTKLGYEVSEKI